MEWTEFKQLLNSQSLEEKLSETKKMDWWVIDLEEFEILKRKISNISMCDWGALNKFEFFKAKQVDLRISLKAIDKIPELTIY